MYVRIFDKPSGITSSKIAVGKKTEIIVVRRTPSLGFNTDFSNIDEQHGNA